MRRDFAARSSVVCAEDEFGDSVVADLAEIGVRVERIDPTGEEPELSHFAVIISATGNDTVNIAMAEHARKANPDLYLFLLPQTDAKKALLETLKLDSVHVAAGLSGVREDRHHSATGDYFVNCRDVPLTSVWAKLAARYLGRTERPTRCASGLLPASRTGITE